TSFLVDFLPILRRTLTRTGFVIDHIHYYADALKPWIARRERWPSFLIRRDPRDISRIWVLEPEGQHYLEIPAIRIWLCLTAHSRPDSSSSISVFMSAP
ncbi:Mu transposase C-terminal domain-containing protein, partial [Aeromonas caviae]